MTFEQVQMPDGSRKGYRKMWRASDGANYAAFYPVGRKGEYYVTWGAGTGGSGGERVGCRETAEWKAAQILTRLSGAKQ